VARSVRIILEEDGYPRELLSPGDWGRAFASGSLRQETDVTVYRDDAPPQYMKAREVAELEPLFRPAAPPQVQPPGATSSVTEPAEPSEPAEPLPRSPPPSPWAGTDDIAAETEVDHYFDDDEEDEEEEYSELWEPAANDVERPSRSPMLILLGGLAVLFVILWIANSGRQPAPTLATEYRVTGTANVRTRPTTAGSEIVGRLRAGDVVTGVPRSSNGELWIEISTGVNAGRFVWARNLAAAP
jgi:hypothetical protein